MSTQAAGVEAQRASTPSERVARQAVLYDRYGAVAYSLCLTIVRHEAVAADIVCQCFSSAPDGETSEVHDWLLAEVHLRAVLAVRQDRVAGPVDGPAATSQRLRDVGLLDPEQRLMVDLAYYHGMTVADIARRLAISPRRVLRVLATGLEAVRAAAPSTVVFPEPVGDTAAERGRTPQG
jgi:DNA-directed RNA polymerase specialized sigma24 family protein